VLTKQGLLDAAWPDTAVTENTLTQRIPGDSRGACRRSAGAAICQDHLPGGRPLRVRWPSRSRRLNRSNLRQWVSPDPAEPVAMPVEVDNGDGASTAAPRRPNRLRMPAWAGWAAAVIVALSAAGEPVAGCRARQLLILNRTRKRAPNLRLTDRVVASVCGLLVRPSRLVRAAIVLKPATAEMKLLDFQRYDNGYRTHAGLGGCTPEAGVGPDRVRANVNAGRCTVGGFIKHRSPRDR
jgi:hypothetical protein